MKKLLTLFIALSAGLCSFAQGLEGNVEERLKQYFTEYKHPKANFGVCELESYTIDHDRRKLDIYPTKPFGYQPFTPESVEGIYKYLKGFLPGPVNYYDITIYADGKPIEELIPNALRKKKDNSLRWKREYKGNPWTKNIKIGRAHV